jgi:hypothetical protein
MAVMLGNLYDAPRSAGAEDDKARKAAEEVTAYEPRFAKLESDVGLLKWMVGFNIGLTMLVAGLVLPFGGLR